MSVLNLSELKPDIKSVDCQISVQGSGDRAGNCLPTSRGPHEPTSVRTCLNCLGLLPKEALLGLIRVASQVMVPIQVLPFYNTLECNTSVLPVVRLCDFDSSHL